MTNDNRKVALVKLSSLRQFCQQFFLDNVRPPLIVYPVGKAIQDIKL